MAAAASPHTRPNAPDQVSDVTPLELLFDLVFVFAVSQLSHATFKQAQREKSAGKKRELRL